MDAFRTIREAKEYVIGRILAQAKQDGVTLSEIERNMLYFSESGWTLPDMMQVSAAFDRDFNQTEYEEKITGIIRCLRESQDETSQRDWDEAVSLLRSEDHYLLVMVDAASRDIAPPRLRGDLRRLILTAAVIVVALTGIAVFAHSLMARYLGFAAFLVLLGGLVYFGVVRW